MPGNPCWLTPDQIASDSIDEAIELEGDFKTGLVIETTFTESIERAKSLLFFSDYFETCGELDYELILSETDGRLISLDADGQVIFLDPL